MFNYSIHYFLFDASRKQIINNFHHNYPQASLQQSVADFTNEQLATIDWSFDGQHDGTIEFSSDHFIAHRQLNQIRRWIQHTLGNTKLYVNHSVIGDPWPDLLYVDAAKFDVATSAKSATSDNEGSPILTEHQIQKLSDYAQIIDNAQIKLYSDIKNWHDEGAEGKAKLAQYQSHIDQIPFEINDDYLQSLISQAWHAVINEKQNVIYDDKYRANQALNDIIAYDNSINDILSDASYYNQYA